MSLMSLLPVIKTRYRALWISVAMFVLVATATRLALLISNFGEISSVWPRIIPAFAVGFVFDLLAALTLAIPFGLYLLCASTRWLTSTVGKWFHFVALTFYLFGLSYLAIVELFFFGEFSARFNYVAVDYLIFPHEVFVNLWDTYPVFQVLIGAFVAAIISSWFLRKSFWSALALPSPRAMRLVPFLSHGALVTFGILSLSTNQMKISGNRILNEIAGNGYFTFGWAAYSNELDYNLYYATVDPVESAGRLRSNVAMPGASWLNSGDPLSINRTIPSHGPTRAFNVVLVLEESFGSHFVGSLTPNGPKCTPQFDSLANAGMFCRNIYATGNRTVRGIEASLCSYPPTPGNSIVRRPGGEHIFSLPQLFKDKGYQTSFLYGGRSYFDNLGQFAKTNGFGRIVDQSDFDSISFKTIWGVCDEDLFGKAISHLDTLHSSGRPFFTTILTVSNHSPYLYPPGRIAADPKEQRRENAVQYADYCIGKFIRDARSHSWFDSTVFVFLADHGARVYGSQVIPMESYRIPILIYCPSLIPIGQPIDVLGSQLDLAPTILGLLNFDYNSEFFGRDLLQVPEGRHWALMSHNRDVSLLRNDTLAVLGIGKTIDLWECGDQPGSIVRIDSIADSSIIWDAIAYYQTAFELYCQNKLRPLAQTPIPGATSHASLTK